MNKRIAVLMLAITMLLSTSGYAFNISGASTIQPIFEDINERRGGLIVQGGGSGAGINNVIMGSSDLGMVSRALSAEEQTKISYQTIAMDALVIIVNVRNPVKGLSKEEVRDIFTGKIATWKQFDFDQNIVLITKEVGRATLDLFEGYFNLESPKRFGSGTKISPSAHEIGSNLEALTLVGGIPGAIAYVSFGTASQLIEAGMPVKMLALDGIAPSRESIANGRYSIIRELNLVYITEPAKAFVESIITKEVKAIIESHGFTPAWQ